MPSVVRTPETSPSIDRLHLAVSVARGAESSVEASAWGPCCNTAFCAETD